MEAALAALRARLERRAGEEPVGEEADRLIEAESARMERPPALGSLAAAFGLSPFEANLLLLCAGVELDGALAVACGRAQGLDRPAPPTFSLALAVLPEAHWSALAPDAPLRRFRLLEVGDGETLVSSPLRIDERVLHALAGAPTMDARLCALLRPAAAPEALPPSHVEIAERVAALWNGRGPWPVAHLSSPTPNASEAVAAAAAARLGLRLYVLRAEDVPADASDQEALTRLWVRESILSGAALLLDAGDGFEASASAFVDRTGGVLMTAGLAPLPTRRPSTRFDVPVPTAAEARNLWREALGDGAAAMNGQVDALASQFRLDPVTIRAISASRLSLDTVWDACRARTRPRLEGLAERVESAAGWDDLVLPEGQTAVLREIAAHVRNRRRVYDEWGFAARGGRGLGISALFAGPSGTGKTMASEVIANALRLDLYRIDLSAVVSKYIGETEKNLRKVFDAADQGAAILLFDEADALFGKRSEVKDSHDRYANIEVSYLLQRMEAYRGLAILTTNRKEALDTAFLRRIRFVVTFPFPDAAQRAAIWRRAFPAETPTEGLEADRLARLNVAGGNIRNIALNAAFLAADAEEPVRMPHLLRAARSECAKIEKAPSEAEIGGWA
jgi:hypothetical protein